MFAMQCDRSPESFADSFVWTLSGNVVSAACQWITLTLIARAGSPELFGSYTLILALTAPLMTFVHLNLRSLLATDVARRYSFGLYMRLRLLTLGVTVCVVVGIALYQKLPTGLCVGVCLLGLSQCLELISDLFYGVHQRDNRMREIAISLIARGVLSVVIVLISVLMFRSIVAVGTAYCVVRLLMLVCYDSRVTVSDHGREPRHRPLNILDALGLFSRSAPLGCVLGLSALSLAIPRIILGRTAGLRELGLFSSLLSVIAIGNTLVSSLGVSALARLAALYSRAEISSFCQALGGVLIASGFMSAIGLALTWAAGPQLLRLAYGPAYNTTSTLLSEVFTAGCISYVAQLLGYALTATRCYTRQVMVQSAGAAAAWCGAHLWIPNHGATGAAISLACTGVVQVAGNLWLLSVVLRRKARRNAQAARERLIVMHILPVLSRGGAEKVAIDILTGLEAARYERHLCVLYNTRDSGLEAELLEAGVAVTYLGKRRGVDLVVLGRLIAQVCRIRPDVVHTHLYSFSYAAIASLTCRCTVVHTVHNLALREVGRCHRCIHRVAFWCGATPVCIGAAVERSVKKIYSSRRVTLIPNGVDVDKYAAMPVRRRDYRRALAIDDSKVVFVSIARLQAQKDPLLLIKAFANGAARDERAVLFLIGEGDMRDAIEDDISRAGMHERIRLLGRRDDVGALLDASDVFVLSSLWEGNPVALMEAMANGKPVIATSVGGVPELVTDGVHGRLVPAGDVEALGRAMWDLLINAKARELMGAAAVSHARARCQKMHMIRSYAHLYTALSRRKADSHNGDHKNGYYS